MYHRRLSTFVRRYNVRTMTTSHRRPAEPLVVIVGSTGTGKSDLAVELATRFRGEIVNADAMQLYDGLPIITNKIPLVEQRGIPHHLLGHIPLHQVPWDVDDFRREAMKTIREIRSRGKLPIVVGGTNYYVDTLIFDEIVLDIQHEEGQELPALEQPTEVLLDELRRVDPEMAGQWHPKDRRKIERSLKIYHTTGKKASDFYAEQQQRKEAKGKEATDGPWENLLFWVYSERDVLKERLDKRVDKMLASGMMEEVRQLHSFRKARTDAGEKLHMTRGIWQAIGYKQFEPYLDAMDTGSATTKELEKLKAQALADMKSATRRYAKYQTKWIRVMELPRLREQNPLAIDSLYLLNSTSISSFADNVIEPASSLTSKFLAGEGRLHPTELSDLAKEVLEPAREIKEKPKPNEHRCETCNRTFMFDDIWEKHIRSRPHRNAATRRNRRALVVIDTPKEKEEKPKRVESPDLASMFG